MKWNRIAVILLLGLVFFALLVTPVASAATEDSGSETIQANQYWYYTISLPNGGGVEYDIKGDNAMNIYFMDAYNFDLYRSGQNFQYIDAGTSLDTQHAKMYFTIDNSAGGTYYIVVESAGNWAVSFTYNIKYGEDLETSFFDFFGAWSGLMCLVWFVLILIWLYVLYWVYKDAKRRGKSGALWLIIVLILGIIGLIIWLIVRPPIQQNQYRAPPQGPPPPPQ